MLQKMRNLSPMKVINNDYFTNLAKDEMTQWSEMKRIGSFGSFGTTEMTQRVCILGHASPNPLNTSMQMTERVLAMEYYLLVDYKIGFSGLHTHML